MFDVDPTELLLVAVVALLVIGPKDLPKAMRFVGHWVGKARGVARQFRSGFDTMVREAELQEMEKKWAEENERIMREHPPTRPVEAEPVAPSPALAPTVDNMTAGDTIVDHAADRPVVMTEQPTIIAEPAAPDSNRDVDQSGEGAVQDDPALHGKAAS